MKFKSKAIEKFYEKYKECQEIDHIVDFLNNKYPYKKRFNFSYEQAVQKVNQWTQQLNKKNKKGLTKGNTEFILDLKDGFSLVRLLDQNSKNWEGYHMGHCVASYTDHDGIYSIRDKANIPHCTLEIENDSIQQIKGKGNGTVAPKYINYCLKALDYFHLKINSYDIENLGYTNSISLDFIKEHFINYKIIKINKQEFLYTQNQLKLVKNFKDKGYQLLMDFLIYNQCFDAIKLLVENGTDINYNEGFLLGYTSRRGYLEIVKLLINNGANIHARDNLALKWASEYGHLEVVKFLINKGADIHADHEVALYHATRNKHKKVVQLLMYYLRRL